MARSESKAIMGYLPVEAKHHDAITSLITPATPATRLLDPFAGGGSIPLEGLRVGANVYSSDVNPVAVLLNKVIVEYRNADECVKRKVERNIKDLVLILSSDEIDFNSTEHQLASWVQQKYL